MEAKDTVIIQFFLNANARQSGTDRVREVRELLEAQAEISFRAGIREVVEWIEKDRYEVNQKNIPALGIIPVSLIHLERWQGKLKEWGL